MIDKSDTDLLVYGYIKYFEISQRQKEKQLFRTSKNKSIIESLIESNYYKACAWDKIIKRKIIVDNDIYFPKGKVGEDIEWCAKVLKNINYDNIKILGENFYMYRQREGSICRNLEGQDLDFIMDMIEKEKCNDTDPMTNIVNSYLANEYIYRLGRINSKEVQNVTQETKERFYNNKDLLKYKLSKKVQKVNMLIKLIGIKKTSKLLGLYIDLKNRK